MRLTFSLVDPELSVLLSIMLVGFIQSVVDFKRKRLREIVLEEVFGLSYNISCPTLMTYQFRMA